MTSLSLSIATYCLGSISWSRGIDLAAILTDVFPALVYEKAHSAEAQHDELVIKRIERAKGWNVEQSATK
jgi:hypothetical protein